MNLTIVSLLMVLLVAVVSPAAAQTVSDADQKSLEITIDKEGNVVVVHHIRDSDEPTQLKLVKGTVSNLEFIDAVAKRESVEVEEQADFITIGADYGEMFVKYNLEDALILENNVWRLDFRYIMTTKFILPDELELFFINERPVLLEKNAFNCHGCQMILEYFVDEPKNIRHVDWEDQEFAVGINTFADIENFEFDQPLKQTSFDVNDGSQFITVVMPLELLWGPYAVFLNDEKIESQEYNNNGTHAWINLKPNSAGQVTIMGTTVVPEFSVIAPLVAGFLAIMGVSRIKRFQSPLEPQEQKPYSSILTLHTAHFSP